MITPHLPDTKILDNGSIDYDFYAAKAHVHRSDEFYNLFVWLKRKMVSILSYPAPSKQP